MYTYFSIVYHFILMVPFEHSVDYVYK